MPDHNHINYWNYLENVTANRNREAENTRHNTVTEGIDQGELEVKKSKSLADIAKIQSEINLIDINSDKAKQEIENLKVKANLDTITALKVYQEIEYVKSNTALNAAQRDKVINDIIISRGQLEVSKQLANIQAGQLIVNQRLAKVQEGQLTETIRKNGIWAALEQNKLEIEKVKLDQNEQRIINETALRINTIWKTTVDVEQKERQIRQEFDIAFAKMDIDKSRLDLDKDKLRWDNIFRGLNTAIDAMDTLSDIVKIFKLIK